MRNAAMAIKPLQHLPTVGEWYLESQTEGEFEVIAVDPLDGIVEIQYFDGDLSELSLEEWQAGKFERVEAPEDWTGPLDKPEEGDVGYDQESFEQPPKHKAREGFEEEEALLQEEAKGRELPG